MGQPDGDGRATETASACEVPGGGARRLDDSRVIAYDGAGWTGVRRQKYKDDGALFEGVVRRTLAAPDSAAFELRYFELEAGGYTTHERHEHVHVVVCIRGRGRARLGDDVHEVGFGDVVYVAPDEPHQFRNPYDEPFGFLCVVDQQRDSPTPVHPAPIHPDQV